MTVLAAVFLALAAAGCAYWLVACGLTGGFFLGRRTREPDFVPPVSILKPLKGLDAGIYANFVSLCRLDYPEFEILFGVGDPGDPVTAVVDELRREFPGLAIRLVVVPETCINPKAGILQALAAEARHEILVVSDSDIRVRPDYLRRVVSPLARPAVGLVTCLYRGKSPDTFTARLEALHMGTTFLPSVLVARQFLHMRFAMGATVSLRKADLARIGGFAAVGDYLADDYHLGVKVADLGLEVRLSHYVTDIVLGPTTFREQWHREVRWAQCNRVSRPAEYPGLLLTFSAPFAVLFLAAAGFGPAGWAVLGSVFALRWATAWLVAGWSDNREVRRWLPYLPLRDMLTALVWCFGAFGRRVVWRGEEYALLQDGRLTPAGSGAPGFLSGRPATLLRGLIRKFDSVLRRVYRIRPFSADETNLLRLSLKQARRDLTLSDETRVHSGTEVGEIHFWNERIPTIPDTGPDLGWALTFGRRTVHSLRLLAEHVEENPSLDAVEAFRGEVSFLARFDEATTSAVLRRWGFDVISHDTPGGSWGRFAFFWKTLYARALIWGYNPASFRFGSLSRKRLDELWISRRTLLARYGNHQPARAGRQDAAFLRPEGTEPAPGPRADGA